MKSNFPLPLHRQGDFYYCPAPQTPPASPLRTAFYEWCGVWLDEQVILHYLQNPTHKIDLKEYLSKEDETGSRLPKPKPQRKSITQTALKQAPATPVHPHPDLTIETTAHTCPENNEKPLHEANFRDAEAIQPIHSYSLKGYDVAGLKEDQALCSISASVNSRLAFLIEYFPVDFNRLTADQRSIYVLEILSGSKQHKNLHASLMAFGVLAEKMFSFDWAVNGTEPSGVGFFQYQPAVLSFREFWVKYMHYFGNTPIPERGKLSLFSRQLEVLVSDERFIRHSSTLTGRLLLLRMVKNISIRIQSKQYQTEPDKVCRAGADNYYLLQQALKRDGDMAGKYWLNTGKGLPGAAFLTKLNGDRDWLMEADIQLYQEQQAYPELPPAPLVMIHVVRYCGYCAKSMHGAGQKKYCSPACQQRARRKKQKGIPEAGEQTGGSSTNGQQSNADHDEAQPMQPEFLQLVLDLLTQSAPKGQVLKRVEKILRDNNQPELADMVADPEKRKYLMDLLMQRLSG
jgi:hypothetical protein